MGKASAGSASTFSSLAIRGFRHNLSIFSTSKDNNNFSMACTHDLFIE